MRKIESEEDKRRGVVTYELRPDKRVVFRIEDVRTHGLLTLMRLHMMTAPDERVPVMQHGRRIGTVPGYFDPFAQSRHFLYDPRPGDFTREKDVWVASGSLGPGDLEAVPGFVWDRDGGDNAS